ncbi:MAG: AAA family ATPase [Planctomycetota bacterium]
MTRWEEAAARIREALGARIVGMEEVVEKVLLCILTGQHALLVGVPGLAKTLLVSSLAELLDLSFARIQFTPDLMPSDITGAEVLVTEPRGGGRRFRFLPGPVFANLILADEINRTPPKTQAALMEAMEERQVTSVGRRHPLPEPFFVLATQNPIEMEGTYPLPAAPRDRFMLRIPGAYPPERTASVLARRVARPPSPPLGPILSRADLAAFREAAEAVELGPALQGRIVAFVRGTRPEEPDAPDLVRDWVAFGASPRAAQALGVAARARALLRGRSRAEEEDVVALVPDVVRHRLVLNYHAASEGIRAVDVVRRLMAARFGTAEPRTASRAAGSVRPL